MTEQIAMFIPITKVNEQRREVWGWAAIEEPDNSDEILDYESSKPHFLDWSNRAQKRSGGKSLGNVRSMHQNVAAGKLIELRPDDVSKGFYVGAKIIDDNEWKKVEQGVYTGFSVGGSYLKRWNDFRNPGKMRYTAKPTELSIVDSPCIPSATFEMLKMDGSKALRKFQPTQGKNMIKVVSRTILVKYDESEHPRDKDGKWTSGGGGGGKSKQELDTAEQNRKNYYTERGGYKNESNSDSAIPAGYEGAARNPTSPTNPTPKEVTERLKSGKGATEIKMPKFKVGQEVMAHYGGENVGAKVIGHLPKNYPESAQSVLVEALEGTPFMTQKNGVYQETNRAVFTEESLRRKSDFQQNQPKPAESKSWEDMDEVERQHMRDKENTRLNLGDKEGNYHGQSETDAKHTGVPETEEYKESKWQEANRFNIGKITKGDVMNRLERIYAILDDVEEELKKADVPEAPETIADIPLKGDYGSYEVEQMPAPNVLMELEANSEPSQEILASHTVKSEDLTDAFEAWLPKVGKMVKSIVAEALADAGVDLKKNSAPARKIRVVTDKPNEEEYHG